MGFLSLLGGCNDLPLLQGGGVESKHEFEVRVTSDPGKPVAGATVKVAGTVVGTTDANGLVRTSTTGQQGERVDIHVACPAAFESPTQPLSITVRRLAKGSRPPTYELSCPPTLRRVVAAIRAENGPNLPVRYLGRTVARTDSSGAAHVLLDVKSGDPIDLTLDTSEERAADLRPQNPVVTFVAPLRDDYIVLDQKFKLEKRPETVRVAPKAREKRPMRL